MPGGNRPYWREKIEGNRVRDRRNLRKLRALGWRVATVWECKVRRLSDSELREKFSAMLGTKVRRDHSQG